jgi:hypothetical protein
MFNLEQSIAEWRRQMLAAGVNAPAPLEELESHLRQDVAALVSAGKPGPEAFQLAAARLGSPASMRIEFNKIRSGQIRSVKIGALLWFAAVIGLAGFLARGLFAGRRSPILSAHILTVTAGYSAAFLAGVFGICSVCWRWCDRLSPIRQQSLGRGVRWFSQIALGLTIVGVMAGLPVSKQLFGSYWQWDPKEIGGLCVIVWFVGLAAAQRFRKMSDRGTMLLCIGGNVVVSLAWFGAGIIDYNQRMHGRGTANYWPLAVFVGIQFCFLLMGLKPSREARES